MLSGDEIGHSTRLAGALAGTALLPGALGLPRSLTLSRSLPGLCVFSTSRRCIRVFTTCGASAGVLDALKAGISKCAGVAFSVRFNPDASDAVCGVGLSLFSPEQLIRRACDPADRSVFLDARDPALIAYLPAVIDDQTPRVRLPRWASRGGRSGGSAGSEPPARRWRLGSGLSCRAEVGPWNVASAVEVAEPTRHLLAGLSLLAEP